MLIMPCRSNTGLNLIDWDGLSSKVTEELESLEEGFLSELLTPELTKLIMRVRQRRGYTCVRDGVTEIKRLRLKCEIELDDVKLSTDQFFGLDKTIDRPKKLKSQINKIESAFMEGESADKLTIDEFARNEVALSALGSNWSLVDYFYLGQPLDVVDRVNEIRRLFTRRRETLGYFLSRIQTKDFREFIEELAKRNRSQITAAKVMDTYTSKASIDQLISANDMPQRGTGQVEKRICETCHTWSELRRRIEEGTQFYERLSTIINVLGEDIQAKGHPKCPTLKNAEELRTLKSAEEFFGKLGNLYPVLTSILSYLSASDASAFLSVTRLKGVSGMEGTIERYTSICRDLPEHADWINLMMAKGHTVLLAGSDIEKLKMRIDNPVSYWGKGMGRDKLRLWLAVRAFEADAQLLERRRVNPRARYVIDGYNGDVEWSQDSFDTSSHVLSTNIIPLPEPPPRDGYWIKTRLPNENKIEIVYTRQVGRCGQLPVVRLCPAVREDGWRNHIITGPHTVLRCDRNAPGMTLVEKTGFGKRRYKLPYFDMRAKKNPYSPKISREVPEGDLCEYVVHRYEEKADLDTCFAQLESKDLFGLFLDCRCGLICVSGRAQVIRKCSETTVEEGLDETTTSATVAGKPSPVPVPQASRNQNVEVIELLDDD